MIISIYNYYHYSVSCIIWVFKLIKLLPLLCLEYFKFYVIIKILIMYFYFYKCSCMGFICWVVKSDAWYTFRKISIYCIAINLKIIIDVILLLTLYNYTINKTTNLYICIQKFRHLFYKEGNTNFQLRRILSFLVLII